MAAARSKDLARDSSNNGIATLRQEAKPFKDCPRSFCAVRIRETEVTSCGSTEVAITIDIPNS